MSFEMNLKIKENVQYTTAIFFLFTGIVICFLSFFLNGYDVKGGALTYLGEAVAFCAGVFSINLYVKNKVNEAELRINQRLDRRIQQAEEEIEEEITEEE